MPKIALAEVRHLLIDVSSACWQNDSCSRIVAACGTTCAVMSDVSAMTPFSMPRMFLYFLGKLKRKATIKASRRLNSGLQAKSAWAKQ